MTSKKDIPTKEDLDFIVDDGYRHDEDPDYNPKDSYSSDEGKYVVSGKEFKKLTKNAKNSVLNRLIIQLAKITYMATRLSGKKVHFGSPKYPDYLIHKDKDRRDKYLARAKKIKNKQGELTYINPESANCW